MINKVDIDRAPDASDRVRALEIRAENEYSLKLYDDEDGQTWIQLREAEDWTAPKPLNEFIRDVWVGNL